MNISLRPWHKDDAPALAEMLNNKNILDNLRDGIPFPYTLQDAFDYLNVFGLKRPQHFFCIDVDGQVAGSICVLPKDDVYSITAEIGYYVAENYWNKGIGSQAIAFIAEYTWQNLPAIKKLYAEVFWFNKASMRALEKNGFYLEGIRKNHIIKNEVIGDDYVWVKFRD
jgi:ribosomal-protein-alanine N-acetyltransferase